VSGGVLYIGDAQNNVVRAVNLSTGTIATVAGNQALGGGYSGDGGAATAAALNFPTFLAVSDGVLYVADTLNNVVRAVTLSTGTIATVAGNQALGGGYSGDGGPATAAALNFPTGLAVSGGLLYVADTHNEVVRTVNLSTGIITTAAGNNALGAGYSGDGGLATSAALDYPLGLAAADGVLYIGDSANNVVRAVRTPTGAVASSFLVSDAQGSVRAQFDDSGTLLGTVSFNAYGNQTSTSGTMSTPFGYTGAYTDPATGLDYLRARWYDPATAQFMSVDPLVATTGQPYEYVGDNPLNEGDPLGLCSKGNTLCEWASRVGDVLQATAVAAGIAQDAADAGTVVCAVADCEEAWIVTVPLSATTGAVATLATCGAAALGKSTDGCAQSAIIEGLSGGLSSGPAWDALANLYHQVVGLATDSSVAPTTQSLVSKTLSVNCSRS